MPLINNNSLIKIAVADHQTLLREPLCAEIGRWENCKVILQAASGKQLLERLNPGNLPDLALIELALPEMNGYETTKALKAKFPLIKIIIFSAYQSEEMLWRIIKCGAQGYISKYDDLPRLKKAIFEMIGSGYFFSDHSASRMIKQAMETGVLSLQNDLPDMEIAFLKQICTEKTYKEIALEMGLSPRQVEYLRQTLFERFSVESRTGLAVFVIQKGIAV